MNCTQPGQHICNNTDTNRSPQLSVSGILVNLAPCQGCICGRGPSTDYTLGRKLQKEMTWDGVWGARKLAAIVALSAKPANTSSKWSQTGHESQCGLASEKAVALSPLDSTVSSVEQHSPCSHPGMLNPEEAVPIRAFYQATHPTGHCESFSSLPRRLPTGTGTRYSREYSVPTLVRHL